MTYTATVTSKRQITIPVEMFKNMNLKKGHRIVFSKQNGFYKMESAADLVNRLAGSLKVPSHLKNIPLETAIKKGIENHFKQKYGLR